MSVYTDVNARLGSFKDRWYGNVSAEELANAGFFYRGIHGKDDRVQCAYCLGMLYNWQSGDTAFGEHLRHFPSCEFVKSKMKKQTVHVEITVTEVESDEIVSLKRELETLKAHVTCKVCLEAPVRVVFLPCQHLACCTDCSRLLEKCPMCREEKLGSIIAYM